MLDAHQRRLLLDALRPPDGWRLDGAITTTFTLDLITLLAVPLALLLFDAEDEDGKPRMDPVALLEALRETEKRLTVFCQAGRIGIPSSQHRLFAFLERAVVEVTAPRGGVFHPKLWVLRWINDNKEVGYRVLCGSRNLTGDRSWDLMVALDGRFKDDRKVAYAANRPLADFVAALPGLALTPVGDEASARVTQIAEELKRVEWELPEHFEEVQFWPLGIGKVRWPFSADTNNRMVISPFVSDAALEKLAENAKRVTLVSRSESLACLMPATLSRFEKVYAMAPVGDAELVADAESCLTGLHAKLVVDDGGWKSSLWVGSINATNAAIENNVEFAVQLVGSKARTGVQAILDGILPLLTDFAPAEPGEEEDQVDQVNLDRMHTQLASWPMRAHVVPGDGGGNVLELVSATEVALEPVPGISVTAWPVTLAQDTHARALGSVATLARFEHLSIESLTSFIAFEIASDTRGALPLRFVRALPLDGAPSDRHQRILRAVLENREQVMRLLLLLLMDESSLLDGDEKAQGEAASTSWIVSGETLLEALLGALHSSPARLDRVHSLVAELQATEEGKQLLPDGFARVWEPIWSARQATR